MFLFKKVEAQKNIKILPCQLLSIFFWRMVFLFCFHTFTFLVLYI